MLRRSRPATAAPPAPPAGASGATASIIGESGGGTGYGASATVSGEKTIDQMAEELWAYFLRVCEGEKTKAEINGSEEILIDQTVSYC